jgi:hypothetical protein
MLCWLFYLLNSNKSLVLSNACTMMILCMASSFCTPVVSICNVLYPSIPDLDLREMSDVVHLASYGFGGSDCRIHLESPTEHSY